MLKFKQALIAGFSLVGFGLAANAHAKPSAPPMPEYSAEEHMNIRGQGMNMTMKSKVYQGNRMRRMDSSGMSMPEGAGIPKMPGAGGNQMITILREDKNLVWTLLPDKTYIETKQEAEGGGDETAGYKVTEKTLGKETVNGITATKSLITVTDPKGKKTDITLWLSPEGVDVKTEMTEVVDGVKYTIQTEKRQLKVGKQDPNLFQIPAGYTKAGGLGMKGMMGGMLGGLGVPGMGGMDMAGMDGGVSDKGSFVKDLAIGFVRKRLGF